MSFSSTSPRLLWARAADVRDGGAPGTMETTRVSALAAVSTSKIASVRPLAAPCGHD